jgi:parvulin-like peptidyl-prolyl isomerase
MVAALGPCYLAAIPWGCGIMTRPILLIVSWAGLLLGCGWSHTALAQGTTLLPPPTSVGQPPLSVPLQNPPPVRPEGVQQASVNVPHGELRSCVVARVNGSPILLDEQLAIVAEYIEMYKKQGIPKEIIERDEKQIRLRSLEDLILREAIIQDASIKLPAPALKKFEQQLNQEFEKKIKKETKAENFKTDDERKEYFKKQGKSLDLMRQQFIRQALANEWIRNSCHERIDRETTREALLEYYQANPEEFKRKERVEWQQIFVDVDRYGSVAEARHQAEVAWQLLRNAKTDADFTALVDKYADGISKARRGAGDGHFKGDIKPKELEQFVFAQPAGGQGPVVETSRGFYIFRVTAHTPAEIISFEKASNEIKKKLENKILQEEFDRRSKEMRDRAFIEMLVGD